LKKSLTRSYQRNLCTYYEGGIVKSKIDYINGERKGMKEYYPDGHLKLETVIKDGMKNDLLLIT
jgi:antitoxin component YwqK of YwqJK toxin-antitoxin module